MSIGDIMKLLNPYYNGVVDMYDITIDSLTYNVEKFKEIVREGKSLNTNFNYHTRLNGYTVTTTSPIKYPISTLLLSTMVQGNLSDYTDNEIASFIYGTLGYYNPEDLYSIHYQISHDKNINGNMSEKELEDYLFKYYKDIYFFRDIFKHLRFTLIQSYNVNDALNHIKKYDNGIIKCNYYNKYLGYGEAITNTEVLKLLKLEPIKKVN